MELESSTCNSGVCSKATVELSTVIEKDRGSNEEDGDRLGVLDEKEEAGADSPVG